MSKSKLNKTNKSNDQLKPSKYSQDSSGDFKNFTTVFFYCILIIFLPIFGFFGSKFFIFDGVYMNLTSVQSNIYSAIVAVVALHLALGLFLYRAYLSSPTPTSTIKSSNVKLD